MNSVVGLVNGWRSQLIEQDEERIDSQSRAGCMLPAVWRNGRVLNRKNSANQCLDCEGSIFTHNRADLIRFNDL